MTVGAAVLAIVLLGDVTDEQYLIGRLATLRSAYDKHASTQSATSHLVRATVVRELAHLPFTGDPRKEAGKLLARIVGEDRSYRIRAMAARAIGRHGTPPALLAMYRTLFGEEGRSTRFAMLYAVLPEAIAGLRHADDLDWLSRTVLRPAARREWKGVLRESGRLRYPLVALTLEGVGRGRLRALGPDVVQLARSRIPTIRVAALRALADLGVGVPLLADAVRDGDTRMRAAAAASALLPADMVRAALDDTSETVRRAALSGLAGRPPRQAVDWLVARLGVEPEPALRLDIAEALRERTGKDFDDDAGLWSLWWTANRATFDGPHDFEDQGRTYFFDVGLRTRRVMFLIDVSGSMGREDRELVSRLEYAARELERAVGRLPPTARFAVVAYAGEMRRFPENGAVGERRAGPAAAEWLRRMKPSGATNTYGALMTALTDPLGPDAILLLSDGNPVGCTWQGRNYSEHEQILAEVRRLNRERAVRIHTVALLTGADTSDEEDAETAADFLRRLAEDNRGEFREVR